MMPAVLIAFGLSLVLTAVLWKTGARLARLDHPNERSLHDAPRPRTGGLAILTAAGTAVLLFRRASPEWIWMAGAAGLVAVISFLDDRRQVPPAIRLVAHLIAASVVVWAVTAETGAPMTPHRALAAGAVVVALAWTTNLFNFMDGMDGFAGGMAVIGFGTYAWLAWQAGAAVLALASAAVAAAAAGFLIFNFPPARIFMGDAGASTLGFLWGAFALIGIRDRVWPWPAALLVFSPFLVDATVTLARRLLRGEKVWRPHRTHYYQRLVRAGWGHRRTVLWEYVLMLGCSATAIVGVDHRLRSWMVPLLAWAAVYAACMWYVAAVERRQSHVPVSGEAA